MLAKLWLLNWQVQCSLCPFPQREFSIMLPTSVSLGCTIWIQFKAEHKMYTLPSQCRVWRWWQHLGALFVVINPPRSSKLIIRGPDILSALLLKMQQIVSRRAATSWSEWDCGEENANSWATIDYDCTPLFSHSSCSCDETSLSVHYEDNNLETILVVGYAPLSTSFVCLTSIVINQLFQFFVQIYFISYNMKITITRALSKSFNRIK